MLEQDWFVLLRCSTGVRCECLRMLKLVERMINIVIVVVDVNDWPGMLAEMFENPGDVGG